MKSIFSSSGGKKCYKSLDDLKTKFLEDYKEYTDQLISIPVVRLQDYRSVPVHLTEDDIRANIKQEVEEILQERMPKVIAKKQEIMSAFSKLKSTTKSHGVFLDVATKLNNLLFEDIFTSENIFK